MTALIIILCLVLIAVIVLQIGRMSELAASIRGEEEAMIETNNRNAILGMVFMVGFLVFCVVSAFYYKNWMLGYGPHVSASAHGGELDSLFNTTLLFTGIVFVACHIALFWFAYKYRYNKDRKVLFFSHDNTLEIVWTAIPAVVMFYLVVQGLLAWNKVTADILPGEDHIEIEAMGQQFAWMIRYPGADNKLGTRDYRLFTGNNPFGQDWSDEKNLDDFQPNEIVLPRGKKVRVRITAKDVLHNFDLPHFRVKMDAVPGLPTYFVFTPEITTEEYRQNLKAYPEFHAQMDPDDPESPTIWEGFNYELACAELCGKGHYSMRRIVRIVEQDEYDRWLAEQQSWYDQTVRGTEEDPYANLSEIKEIPAYLAARIANEFNTDVAAAMASDKEADKTVILKHVYYSTGQYSFSGITENYYLNNVVKFLKDNPAVKIALAGHTDSDGDESSNQLLSENRANAIAQFLVRKGIPASRFTAAGYGESKPIADNDTEEGKALNRRTEFKIIDSVVKAAQAILTEAEEVIPPAAVE